MDMDISVLTYFSNKIKIFFNYYFQKNLLPLHFIKLEFAQVKKRYEYPSEAHKNTEQNFVTCLIQYNCFSIEKVLPFGQSIKHRDLDFI